MPGMDGLQLLVEIKQQFPHLPVMMVIAYGADERGRQAAEYGAVAFLTEPVDFERLKAQLRQLPSALDRRNAPLTGPSDRSSGPGEGRLWGRSRSSDRWKRMTPLGRKGKFKPRHYQVPGTCLGPSSARVR